MNRTSVRDLTVSDSPVRVSGFVASLRRLKKLVFVVLRDHTGSIQVTFYLPGLDQQLSTALAELTPGSAVTVVGRVVDNAAVRDGGRELQPSSIAIESLADTPLPLTDLDQRDRRLDWRFLDLRRPEALLIFKVQTTALNAMRDFWSRNGFLEIQSPKLMAAASESGSELFRVDYFGGDAFLAQSPQFYKQMAMAAGFDRICEVGPVFRANPSHTKRHDTEFTSIDMEISWIDSHEDVMALEEQWLLHVLARVAKEHGREIKESLGVDVVVPATPFPRITMLEARSIVESKGVSLDRPDLSPEAERTLGKYVLDSLGHEFVFVTDYPTEVRPFYHMRQPHAPSLTLSFDLVWRGLEITTGAQREHRHDVLRSQASEQGLTSDEIGFYLDFFRYGCPPHGGFGFGLTRMLMVMLSADNVREVTYLYRGPTRLRP